MHEISTARTRVKREPYWQRFNPRTPEGQPILRAKVAEGVAAWGFQNFTEMKMCDGRPYASATASMFADEATFLADLARSMSKKKRLWDQPSAVDLMLIRHFVSTCDYLRGL